MFAVMKHWDVMIGVDRHICWPPDSPIPLPSPVAYITTQYMKGIQLLTPMFAESSMTLYGWTMQRGTDIGPGIPHVGAPSILTPMDVLFSSSVSYFGPSAYQHEAEPCAAALLVAINLNANCQEPVSMPTGLVFCITTHFTWMTPLDIVYGFACMAFDALLEYAGGKWGEVATPFIMRKIVNPVGKKVMSKIASKSASGTAAGAAAKAGSGAATGAASKTGSGTAASQASKTSGDAAKPSAGGNRSQGPAPGKSAAPSKPRPASKPEVGGHRSQGPAPGKSAAPSKPRPAETGGQRPPSQWRPAKPEAKPVRPPRDVWVPGKAKGPRPDAGKPKGPAIGGHRAEPQRPNILKIYKSLGWEILKDLGMEAPMSVIHMLTMDLMAMSGVEEFGAPPAEQEG